MDLKIMAAAALGCSFGLMFNIVVNAIESHYRMKLMLLSALEHEKTENSKKKTQK